MDDSQPSADDIEHDETDGSSTVSIEACGADSPSMAVVTFVAALKDAATPDLDPLYGSVDPEALDSLTRSIADADGDGRIEFQYEGYEITLANGAITARPLTE